MNRSDSAVRRYAVVLFYLLAFALSWLGWVPQALHARGLFPFDSPLLGLLGGGGPTLAAVIVLLLLRDRNGLRDLFRSLFRLRVSFWWYLFAFGFWVAVTALALGLGALFRRPFRHFAWVPHLPSWPTLLSVFIIMLLSNVWEEIGWRGFALPRLRQKAADLPVALLMGSLWFLWHLPLLLNPSSPMSALPWYGMLIFCLSQTVIYTWLYARTASSLFFVSILHAMSNTMASVLLDLGVFVPSYPFVVGVTTLVALVLVLIYGPRRFEPSRQTAGQ